MKESVVIRRLMRHMPKDAQEMLDYCGLPLQHIGCGQFRAAYHVLGTSLIVKVPHKGRTRKRTEENVQHSRDEYTVWKRMRASIRKFKALKRYMPELVYYNSLTGIIVVRKYDKLPYSKEHNALIRELELTVTSVMKTKEADIHYGNLGRDEDGNVKIIDMGLFIGGKV
jgi:hypothetical protein